MAKLRTWKSGLCLLVFGLAGVSNLAPAASVKRDTEYRSMVERLNESYQDFFLHIDRAERFEKNRRSGVKQYKEEKQKEIELAERARKRYVQNRKKAPDMTPLELAWEHQQEREQKVYNQNRLHYVEKQKEVKKIEDSARKIPEGVRAGLIPAY
ncbi:MAG: hypothetical protein KDD22_07960 [Bdellovibrionales bacterium]|nr:hypothetical protein [Bdellovibrionales bacterium]